MEQGPERIGTTEMIKEEIAKVQSFDRLFTLIDWYEKMKGEVPSEVVGYSADEIRTAIEGVLKRREQGEEISEEDLIHITRELGIRDAVMRILNIEALKDAAAA